MMPANFGSLFKAASLPVVTACALSACDIDLGFSSTPAKFRGTKASTVPHRSGGALRVKTANGKISVRRDKMEQAVTIKALVRATSQERLDQVVIKAERTEDGTLAVSAVWPGKSRKGNEGCGFEVVLPDPVPVDLHSSNGKISITGMKGPAKLRSSNGAISIGTHQGSAKIKTSNGAVTVKEIDGTLAVHTSNGAITVASAQGAVDLETSNGAVVFTTGAKFNGELAVSTSNGSISTGKSARLQLLSVKKRSAHLQIGSGGGKSRVRTSNGSIKIQVKG